nr:isoform 2 of serine--trna ligase, chloroplastic/mitochondrial [Quercus suber]
MGMGGTTLQTLKLASIPSFSSSRFVFKPLPKTLTFLAPSRHGRTQRPPFPLLARALSAAPAVQTAPDETAVKPQWKAAIDFKWIRENKEAVALNIEKRNSNANLETVLQLYDKMTHLQKIAGS